MARIRIWDRAAIAKGIPENVKPGLWHTPDSKMREGETQAEWRLRMLLRDLEALAADAETLMAAYAGVDRYLGEMATDDLANDVDWHLELATLCVEQGLITEAMQDKVRVVDAKLFEMSDRHDESLWTNEALRTWQEWGGHPDAGRRGTEGLRIRPRAPSSRVDVTPSTGPTS